MAMVGAMLLVWSGAYARESWPDGRPITGMLSPEEMLDRQIWKSMQPNLRRDMAFSEMFSLFLIVHQDGNFALRLQNSDQYIAYIRRKLQEAEAGSKDRKMLEAEMDKALTNRKQMLTERVDDDRYANETYAEKFLKEWSDRARSFQTLARDFIRASQELAPFQLNNNSGNMFREPKLRQKWLEARLQSLKKQHSQLSMIVNEPTMCYWSDSSKERLPFFMPNAFALQLLIDAYKEKQPKINGDIFDRKKIVDQFEKLMAQSKEIRKYLVKTRIPQLSETIGVIEAELVSIKNSK